MKSQYEWLLFDADNTLFDFDGAAQSAFLHLMEDLGLDAGESLYARYKLINNSVWKELEERKITAVELRVKRFALFLESVGHAEDPARANELFLEYLVEHSTLLEGAIELLTKLSVTYNLAIITNGLKEVQRPRLNHTGITPFFKAIVVSDEIGIAKPHPGFFDHTFREIRMPSKEKVLVIGDNLNSDIRGGFDYGVDTVWFNPSRKDNPTPIQPSYTIERLQELYPILGEDQ